MFARIAPIPALLMAAGLSACAVTDEKAGRFFVQPDRYVLYNCREIAQAIQTVGARQLELERLIARAGSDASGRFVSELAYGPEYAQLRGQMSELNRTSTEKHCKFSSGSPTSEQVIR
jgi:hypothetical protein